MKRFPFLLLVILTVSSISVFAQTDPYPVVRTKTHSESFKFGPAGTVSIVGAPTGAIRVLGWEKNEVKIESEVIVKAANEEDAARLTAVTGFGVEETSTSLTIHSIGTHDKKSIKKIDKKFPKRLRKNPFELNYTIYVPSITDLRIDGGTGNLELNRVEGVFIVNFFETNANLHLTGGRVMLTVGTGNIDVAIGTRSWRGRSAEIKLTKGDINLRLPKQLNANLTASVLREGSISNSYSTLEPKPRTKFTNKSIIATAGSGGASLSFVVGDGNLKILDLENPTE